MGRNIYILGYGRSGSTLLEGLLAEKSGRTAIGESCYLYSRGISLDPLCSCGSRTRECSFWSEIIQHQGRNFSDEEIVELADLRERYESTQRLVLNMIARLFKGSGVRLYGDAISKLYSHLRERKINYIDSSKMPGRVIWMPRKIRADTDFILLLRDPRGVAYSNTKLKKIVGLETDSYMPTFSVTRSFIAHILNTLMCLFVTKIYNLSCKFILYEDFVRNPEMVIAQYKKSERDGNFSSECHSFSGNPSRFKEQKEIKLDDEWVRRLPKRQILLGGFIKTIELCLVKLFLHEVTKEN